MRKLKNTNEKSLCLDLVPGGILVIEGIYKEDCWEIKELFGRG